MLRTFIFLIIAGFWITMMSLLIGREFFQLAPIQTAHEVLTLEDTHLREEYQAMYLGKQRIGFGFTVLENLEGSDEAVFELRHSSYLSFLLLGRENEMLIKGKAHLDNQLHLQGFSVRIKTKDYWTEIQGKLSENNMSVEIKEKEGETLRKIIPMEGPVLYSESLDLLWTPENLRLGKRGRIHLWNPLVMSVEKIDFWVSKKEKVTFENQTVEAFVIRFKKGDLETRSWVSPEGITLRKETIAGLLHQKEPSYQIFDAMRLEQDSRPDLPNLFSVPSNKRLEKPLSLNYLKIKIQYPQREEIHEIKREDFSGLEDILRPVPGDAETLAPFLEATNFVQSNDPLIQEAAKEIAGDDLSALGTSLKLMDWVYQYVTPSPTGGLPSARQVLAVKKGDCNEYTALFTALARSLGIPTKMIAGLVYEDGRFFYHAWPQIYLGKWISLDPTFHQVPVDVTHIPLVEGNIQAQVSLAEQLGRINVLILEAQ